MLSAPATIPATNAATFDPALAPLVRRDAELPSANLRNPACSASATIGTSPDADTRFGSLKLAHPTSRM